MGTQIRDFVQDRISRGFILPILTGKTMELTSKAS